MASGPVAVRPGSVAVRPGPVVWLIWDAAADWVARRLLAEGALPHLARLAKEGVRAAARPPWPNCQTPPSLATLFCGVWPRTHGVAGFAVPDPDPAQPVLAARSGFEPGLLQSVPVWRRAVRAGRRVVLPHLPWVLPLAGDPAEEPRELYRFAAEAYSRRFTRARVWPLEELGLEKPGAPGTAGSAGDAPPAGARVLRVGPSEFRVWEEGGRVLVQPRAPAQPGGAAAETPSIAAARPLGGAPAQPGGAEMVLRLDPDASGTPGPDARPWSVELGPGAGAWLWAYRRPGDGRLMLAHSGAWQMQTWPQSELAAAWRAAGPFVGEGLGSLYRVGAFGPRLGEGGDGAAEDLLVRSLEPCAGYFEAIDAFAAGAYPADLYVFYQPAIDDVEHELLGWCDPASRAFRPDLAARLWGAVGEVYRMADRHLGRVLEAFGPQATVILSSDHGMGGVATFIMVNSALARAGLLAFGPGGAIDLERTQALYHPANNGSLWVNTDDRPGGLVPARRRHNVARRAARALWRLQDPATGRRVFHRIHWAGAGRKPGWPWAFGDLYLVAEDGYDLRPEAWPEPLRPAPKSANHTGYPERRSLQGVFFARGPNLRRGADLGVVDNRDVCALVYSRLGVQPPPGLEGRVPRAALGG